MNTTSITDADLRFDELGAFNGDDEALAKDNFLVETPLGGVISGTVEVSEGLGYVTVGRCPMFMTAGRARQVVADAIWKGRDLGMRRAFASKLRASVDAGEVVWMDGVRVQS